MDVENLKRAVDGLAVSDAEKSFLRDLLISPLATAVAGHNPHFFSDNELLSLASSEQDLIVENAVVGLLLVKDRTIVRVNRKMEEMFGYRREEVVGKSSIIGFQSAGDYEKLGREAYPLLAEGGVYSAELRMKRADGTLFWCHLHGQAVDPKDLSKGAIWILEDITRRKEAEEALVMAKHRAEQATQLKDMFISMVSHDLRAPLASAVSLLKILGIRESIKADADGKMLLGRSVGAIGNLIKMVDQLLDISRLSTGKIAPRKRFFDVRAAAEGVFEEYYGLALEKGITLHNDIPARNRVYGDRDLLVEVFANLVSNAVKFCTEGDTVRLHLPNGTPSHFAVTDTGKGINPKFVDDLFRQEVKTSSAGTAGERGTGLGLPFCKEIIAAHGGDIRAESAEGKGSTFFVELPAVRPLVLIVDDHEMVRNIFRDYLATLDFDFIEAENGRHALAAMENHMPHLVLTDINMPEMDGFDFLREMRKNPAAKDIPAIVITSDTKSETRDKAFAAGADDFVDKAANPTDLIPRVKRFFT